MLSRNWDMVVAPLTGLMRFGGPVYPALLAGLSHDGPSALTITIDPDSCFMQRIPCGQPASLHWPEKVGSDYPHAHHAQSAHRFSASRLHRGRLRAGA